MSWLVSLSWRLALEDRLGEVAGDGEGGEEEGDAHNLQCVPIDVEKQGEDWP